MRKFIFAGFVCIFLLVIICTAGCVGNSSVFSDPIVGTWDPDEPYLYPVSEYYSTYYIRYVFESDGTGTEYWYDDCTITHDASTYNPDALVKKYDLTWKANETDDSFFKYYIISYEGYSGLFDEKIKIRISSNGNSKTLIDYASKQYSPSTTGDIIDPGDTIISTNNGKIEEDILGLWYGEKVGGTGGGYDAITYDFEADGTGTMSKYNFQTGKYIKIDEFIWSFNNIRNGGYEGRGHIQYEWKSSDDFKLEDSKLDVYSNYRYYYYYRNI